MFLVRLRNLAGDYMTDAFRTSCFIHTSMHDVILSFVEQLQGMLGQRLIPVSPIALNLAQPVNSFACPVSAHRKWHFP